ncbi:hypothetical protein DAPPUDRAFT_276530, partial [Daphnia pulex]
VAFNEAVAEVSCEPIKKHVQEGIGNTNRKPPKRSKRKQTFGANNLPEIDDNNTISERVEIIHKTKRGKTAIVPIGLRGTALDHARGSRCGAAIDLEETFRMS